MTMKRSLFRGGIVLLATAASFGCLRTKSEVDVKPVDINLNISGRLELVITDARQAEAAISGAKPKRTVRPEDIGLPPVPRDGAMRFEEPTRARLMFVSDVQTIGAAADDQAALIRAMAARYAQVATLRARGSVGEGHDGFLAPRASLSAAERALVDAENRDRAQVYALEAAAKGTTGSEVALGYYLARLEHVAKGTWAERYDKSTGQWQWFQWDR